MSNQYINIPRPGRSSTRRATRCWAICAVRSVRYGLSRVGSRHPGAHARYGNVRTAAEYGYLEGDVLAGSGHMRLTVSPDATTIDYILSVLPRDEGPNGNNGGVAYSYSIPAPFTAHNNQE